MSIIFLDIDGTLVDADGYIPTSALNAILQARRRGHYCVLNTGRPKRDIDLELLDIGFDGFACSCGQYLEIQGQTIYHDGLDHETSYKIAREGHRCRLGLYFESEYAIWIDDDVPPLGPSLQIAINRHIRNGDTLRRPTDTPDFCFDKFSVSYTESSNIQQFLDYIAPYCEIIDQGQRTYECPKLGHSKGSGVDIIAQAFKVMPEDCYAIGDSGNDLSMFQRVGHPIAMGGSPVVVQQAAKFVTKPLREDGIYFAMKQMGLI